MASVDVLRLVGQAMWSSGTLSDVCDTANVRLVKSFSDIVPIPTQNGNNMTDLLQDAIRTMLSTKTVKGSPLRSITITKGNSIFSDRIYPTTIENVAAVLSDPAELEYTLQYLSDFLWYVSCKPESSLCITFTFETSGEAIDDVPLKTRNSMRTIASLMFKGIKVCNGGSAPQELFSQSMYDVDLHATQLSRMSLGCYLASMYNAHTYFNVVSNIFRKYCNGLTMELLQGDQVVYRVSDSIAGDVPESAEVVTATRHVVTPFVNYEETATYGRSLSPADRDAANRQNIDMMRDITACIVPGAAITCRVLMRPSELGAHVLQNRAAYMDAALSYVPETERAMLAQGKLQSSHPLRVIRDLHGQILDAYHANPSPETMTLAQEMMNTWEAYWLLTHCDADNSKVSSCIANRAAVRIQAGSRFLGTIYGIQVHLDAIAFE